MKGAACNFVYFKNQDKCISLSQVHSVTYPWEVKDIISFSFYSLFTNHFETVFKNHFKG